MVHIGEKLYIAITEDRRIVINDNEDFLISAYDKLLKTHAQYKDDVLSLWPKAISFEALQRLDASKAFKDEILHAPVRVGNIAVSLDLMECAIEVCQEIYKAGKLPDGFKKYIN